MDLLFALALLAIVLGISIELSIGLRKLTHLEDIPPLPSGKIAKISIIIPALNEEETIAPALASVLSLDYKNLEIIVVNDRSTDRTGEILDKTAERYPQVKVFHKKNLPPGWLGKNHALQFGARQATGEFLLFTDADIVMEKTTLLRAINHMQKEELDHLSIIFKADVPGGLLRMVLLEFGGALMWKFKPWNVKNPESKHYMGVGAFNMVRSPVYYQIGMHERISMCPIDDIMLGKVIKEQKFRSDCVAGYDFVSVEWYPTIKEAARGLEKNIFAGLDYSLLTAMGGAVFMFLAGILPVIAVVTATGPSRIIYGLIVLTRILSSVDGLTKSKLPPLNALWILCSTWFGIYMLMNATLKTIYHKGITWRGTFYPLEELKKKR